jgi:hypothetical protein
MRSIQKHRLRMLAAPIAVAGLVLAASPSWAAAGGNALPTWGANDSVAAMVTAGGKTIIGGAFTAVNDPGGHSFPASHLAVIDSSTGVVDLTWQGSADDDVHSLAVLGNTLFVGGDFNHLDGVSHRNLGALNLTTGALLPGFAATANRAVDALAAVGTSVYAGGPFSSVTDASGTTTRNFIAKLDATTGAVAAGWSPQPDQRVRALQASTDGSAIYAGGDFSTVNGVSHRSTVELTGADPGGPVASYHGAATNQNAFAPVLALDLDGSTLYVAAGGSGGGCTALDATTGSRVWTKHSNGNVQAVQVNHGIVYCGGHFGGDASFDGQTRFKLAAVNAAAPFATTDFAPRFNSALGIFALAGDGGHLFTGGDFTKVNQQTHNHYAVFADTP